MYKGYRVVVVTPAGRRRYMEVLGRYVMRDRGLVDEWRLWEETVDVGDLAYIRGLEVSGGGFVTVERLGVLPLVAGDAWSGTYGIHRHFGGCCSAGTVYIRLDDDVVWLGAGSLESLVRFRLENRGYFLVLGNVVNNGICSHLHQRMGLIDGRLGLCGYSCFDGLGWGSGGFGELVHRGFLRRESMGLAGDYGGFGRWEMRDGERFSVNCVCWLGEDFREFGGEVGVYEEQWLTVDKPVSLGRVNCVCGSGLVSHYAYGPQRGYLDGTPVLDWYRRLSLRR